MCAARELIYKTYYTYWSPPDTIFMQISKLLFSLYFFVHNIFSNINQSKRWLVVYETCRANRHLGSSKIYHVENNFRIDFKVENKVAGAQEAKDFDLIYIIAWKTCDDMKGKGRQLRPHKLYIDLISINSSICIGCLPIFFCMNAKISETMRARATKFCESTLMYCKIVLVSTHIFYQACKVIKFIFIIRKLAPNKTL